MAAVPPTYDPNTAQRYPPLDTRYPPPQPGYPPQQPGYPSPTQQGYPQAASAVVVVVGQQAPATSCGIVKVISSTSIQQQQKEKVNHFLHLLITICLFPPWVFVWMILCCIYGC